MKLNLNYDFFLKLHRLVLDKTNTSLEVKSKEIKNNKKLNIPSIPIIEEKVIEKNIEIEESIIDNSKLIALTFDGGPSYYTKELLDILNETNSTATFFVLGNNIRGNEEILKKINNNGNQIGVLGYTHTPFTNMSIDNVLGELAITNDLLLDAGITPSRLVRPPFGKLNETIKANINAPFILWNIDTEDFKYQDKNRIKFIIKRNIKEGSIILLHDQYQTTLDAIKELIPELQKEGYKFTTIDQMNKKYDMHLLPGRVYAKI